MDVIVDRSGRVPWLSQLREPTSCLIWSLSFCCSCLVGGFEMIDSTGLSDLYGVKTGLDD